jgi:hypothetical protein
MRMGHGPLTCTHLMICIRQCKLIESELAQEKNIDGIEIITVVP